MVGGGAGFIGSHLCEALLRRGAEVLCVDNLVTGSLANVAHLTRYQGFNLVQCDVSQGVEEPGPLNAVFHLASPASPVDYLRLPLETMRASSIGTWHLLDVARRARARFVLASTSEVYGDPNVHPQPETYWGNVNPVGPRAVYDESKRFAETLTSTFRTTHGVDAGIVRIFNTYGPGMRPHDGRMVPTFVRQALAAEPLTIAGDGLQTRSLCYVDDLVDGLLRMAESSEPGPVNLGNPDERSVLQIAQDVRSAVGSASRLTFMERPIDDPSRRCPDIDRAQAVLGWRPATPWMDGLSRTVEWFRVALAEDQAPARLA